MKILMCLIMCFILLFDKSTESTKLGCTFYNGAFSHSLMNSVYYCTVSSSKINSKQEAVVDEFAGTHLSGFNNDNVVGLQISGGTASYPPKNVEKHFKNLKAIAYQSCHLKEIHQNNLKPFPMLLDLFLDGNQIQVLEVGLFDYNPELVYFGLQNNKIVQIHSKVFDNLKKVTHIHLSRNICINKDVTSPSQIQELIQQISTNCQNSEFLNLDSKLNNLENSSKSLTLESFNQQLENLQNEFKTSKFNNYSSFEDRLESLKSIKFDEAFSLCNKSEQVQSESTTEQTTTRSPCNCQLSNQTSSEKSQKIYEIKEILEKIRSTQYEHEASQIDAMSVGDNKIKVMDESLTDFQNKIDALSTKVTSIADIVEQLEDKLGKIFKTLNIKVTIDV